MQLYGLNKSYGDKQALKNVSLDLKQNEVTGLLGVNGAGKSTLIKCLLGFVRPDSGTLSTQQQLPGHLPEIAELPGSISGQQLIAYALRLRNSDAAKAAELLQEVGLAEEAWQRRIDTYSKGMRQRTALAFALAGDPQWLVLDEPMSGLDALGRQQVLEILRNRSSKDCGILICSHIVPDLVRICSRILIMGSGEVREEIPVVEHSMQEAEMVENRLRFWSGANSHV